LSGSTRSDQTQRRPSGPSAQESRAHADRGIVASVPITALHEAQARPSIGHIRMVDLAKQKLDGKTLINFV
jgi:hypothetical protein